MIVKAIDHAARFALKASGFVHQLHTSSVGRISSYAFRKPNETASGNTTRRNTASEGTGTERRATEDTATKTTKPALFMVHGIGSSAAPYAGLARRLRATFDEIVLFELPHHGKSGSAAVPLTPEVVYCGIQEAMHAELSRASAPARPYLFGNSLGGGVALRFAIEHQDAVGGVILSSPAGAPTPEEDKERFFAQFSLASREDAATFLGKLYHRPPWFSPLLLGEMQRAFAEPWLAEFFASVTDDDFADPDELARLTAPLLLMWGESERLMPRSHLAYFKEHLPPHAEIVEPPGYAHSPYLEEAPDLCARIEDFVHRVEAQKHGEPA